MTLRVDLDALGVARCRRARLVRPDAVPVDVRVEDGQVRLDSVGLWTVVRFEGVRS